MTEPPLPLRRVLAAVDRVSEGSGRASAWLIVPFILGITYEVGARYLFNAPTIWAYDLAYMLYASIFMLGAAYTLRRGAHVRADFLYNALAERKRAFIDVAGYLLFLPLLGLFLHAMTDHALHSWEIREKSSESAWYPPLYPLKWMMVVALALLLLQCVAELVRAVAVAFRSPAPCAPNCWAPSCWRP